jgi:hypothetical protein
VSKYGAVFGVSVNIWQQCNAASMYSASDNIYNVKRGGRGERGGGEGSSEYTVCRNCLIDQTTN